MSSIILSIVEKTCNPCQGDAGVVLVCVGGSTVLFDAVLTITGIVLTILGALDVILMPLWGVITCGAVTGIIALGAAYVLSQLTGGCSCQNSVY